MEEQNEKFGEWLSKLVRETLPFEIQRKIVQCEDLSRSEFKQFASTVLMAAQAESLTKVTSTANTCDTLLAMARRMECRQQEHGKVLHAIDLHTMPALGGIDELFSENTPVQREMFIAGFRLLKMKVVKKPHTAATRVFEDFQRRKVSGRYENRDAFCTQFARKWKHYNERPRI